MNANLIINTTPWECIPILIVNLILIIVCLNKNHILFDLVYNPEMTAFLKMGGERGCSVITGYKNASFTG